MSYWGACAVLACLLLGTAAAHAQPADAEETLTRARAALEAHKYHDAISLVAPLRKGADPRSKIEALEVTAIAEIESGQTSAGSATVAELYTIAPGFAP